MVEVEAGQGCSCGGSTPDIAGVVEEVVGRIGKEKESLIPILQGVQEKLNYLPSEALRHICRITEITPAQITSVSTFYSQFRHIPSGRHIIKVCAGTACHVKGSQLISEAFRRELKIEDSRNASPDMLFSVEEVACLGCCTLAPVVQIDEKTYGHVKPTQVNDIIIDFLSSGSRKASSEKEVTDSAADAEVRIGIGSCCVAGGSREIISEVFEVRDRYDLNIKLKPVGCVGVCNQTPLMEIIDKSDHHSRYTNVRKNEVEKILLKHVKPGRLLGRLRYGVNDLTDTFLSDNRIASRLYEDESVREKYVRNFLESQVFMATKNSGMLDPLSFDEYSLSGGFDAFKKCLAVPDREEIIHVITESGLRGRGGAGFLTGRKWSIVNGATGDEKFVICNGDEGDPGAFMDRMLLESFPYRVIEGMMIAAFATGAGNGIFYIRAEYPLAVKRIRHAIAECYKNSLLGKNISGSIFSFDLRVFEGAGAFVCGEETALIASVEGKRGTPNFRPPYPAVRGYHNKPTLINNVETLALVPWILNNGAKVFGSVGTCKSKGTKVFALAGKISKGGLIEVPMGITIRQIVEKIGCGVAEGRTFKAVQIGGPSGGCIPAAMADLPVDYEKLTEAGAMMGSGGMVVLDDTDCMVDMAKYFLTFTHKQSCGKCTFCRIGTKKMLDILVALCEGKASHSDLDDLERLCHAVKSGSLCGLGRTSPNPLLTGLKYFREEYEEHTRGICRAKVCRGLIQYRVNEKCNGCTICSRECPVAAIPYTPYSRHSIDQDLCTKCDNCRVVCPVNAIEKVDINGQD